jgi:hypothetical protein
MVNQGVVVKAEVWGLIHYGGLVREQMWLSDRLRYTLPRNSEAALQISSQRNKGRANLKEVIITVAHAGFRELGIGGPLIPCIDMQCSHCGEGYYHPDLIPNWVYGMKLEPGVYESQLTNSSRAVCASKSLMWRDEDLRLIPLHKLATYRGPIKCPHNPPCRGPYPDPGAPVRQTGLESTADNDLGPLYMFSYVLTTINCHITGPIK